VELKEYSLTSKGYLDLAKVPDLLLEEVGSFLKDLRVNAHLRQKDVAEIVGVSKSLVAHWETNRSRMRLLDLVKITEKLNIPRDAIYSLIDQGELLLKSRLPVKLERIREIIQYLYPQKYKSYWQINVIKCAKETLQRIRETLDLHLFIIRTNQAQIHSKELHNYLTTFFQYTKLPKIHPPLTKEVVFWYENGVDLKKAIICPLLQTDGTIGHCEKPTIKLYGNSKILHDYLVDAIYYEYKELPTSYFIYSTASQHYSTEYKQKKVKAIIDEVMKLAGNSKTAPAVGQSVEEYLAEPQPHLNYLIDAPVLEQQIALRIWASTEGSVGIQKYRERIYPNLKIACAHPILVKQLKKMSKQQKINFTIVYSQKYWSGISKLYNSSISACIEFLKLGGFIKGVKISSNSPYHEGIDKDILTLGILEYIKQRRKTKTRPKKLPLNLHHHNVNKIIENKEYKTEHYYVNYFTTRL
jgi:transcriptional regulator with XRE-family HTH domain